VSSDAVGPFRRPVPAIIAAVCVAASYLLLGLLQIAVSVTYDWASSRFQESFGQIFSISFLSLRQELPVVIVVVIVAFLGFWGMLPIHGAIRFGQALARGVLGAAIVGVVVGIVVTIQYLAIVHNLSVTDGTGLGADSVLRSMAEAADNSVTHFVQTAPLVVLGALILWSWTRAHPRASALGTTVRGEPDLV
jgi:hypothetical protein